MELVKKWGKHEQKIAFSNSICWKIKVPKIVIFLYETQIWRRGKQTKIKGVKMGKASKKRLVKNFEALIRCLIQTFQ